MKVYGNEIGNTLPSTTTATFAKVDVILSGHGLGIAKSKTVWPFRTVRVSDGPVTCPGGLLPPRFVHVESACRNAVTWLTLPSPAILPEHSSAPALVISQVGVPTKCGLAAYTPVVSSDGAIKTSAAVIAVGIPIFLMLSSIFPRLA